MQFWMIFDVLEGWISFLMVLFILEFSFFLLMDLSVFVTMDFNLILREFLMYSLSKYTRVHDGSHASTTNQSVSLLGSLDLIFDAT